MEAFQAEVAWTALAAIGGQGFALRDADAGAGAGAGAGEREPLPTGSPRTWTCSARCPAAPAASPPRCSRPCGTPASKSPSTPHAPPPRATLPGSRSDAATNGCRSTWAGTGASTRPILLAVGPVLHLDDAVGNKVGAMIGRGLPRNYLDVAAALRRFDRGQLLKLGFRCDPELCVVDAALAMRRLDQIPDRQFRAYGLTPDQSADARVAFRDWPREPARDV